MKRVKEVKILGCTYKVEWKDTIMHTPDSDGDNKKPYWVFGRCSQKLRIIEISTKDEDGTPIPEDIQINTFWHEVAHAIIDEGGYHNYSQDEPFVEWLSKNLQLLIKY